MATQAQPAPVNAAGQWAMSLSEVPAEVLSSITRIGIVGMGKLSEGRLSSIGAAAARMESAGWWAMGDAAAELADRNPDTGKGTIYAELARKWHIDQQTVENRASVARRVPYADRRADVSPSHHAEVANRGLDSSTRREYLAHAAETRLSVADFRTWIRQNEAPAEMPVPATTLAGEASQDTIRQNGHQADSEPTESHTEHSKRPVGRPRKLHYDPADAVPVGRTPDPSINAQATDITRPLVIAGPAAEHMIRLCGTVAAAEERAAEVLIAWLANEATLGRFAKLELADTTAQAVTLGA